jgi:hypothetical protein
MPEKIFARVRTNTTYQLLALLLSRIALAPDRSSPGDWGGAEAFG